MGKMGGECGTRVAQQKCLLDFGGENLKECGHLKKLDGEWDVGQMDPAV